MYTRDRYSSTGLTRAAFTKKTLGVGNELTGFGGTLSGGQYNTASGYYSTVGGGYNNNASGRDDTVGGGNSNTASGYKSTVSGGYSNTASASGSVVGGGYGNSASAYYATIGGGKGNIASGRYSWVPGGTRGDTRELTGAYAYATGSSYITVTGIHTIGQQVHGQTFDDTPQVCVATTPGGSPASTNVLVLKDNSAAIVTAKCVAVDTSGRAMSVTLGATVKRENGAATTAIIGAVTSVPNGASGGFAPSFTLLADTFLGAIVVRFTGLVATQISTGAEVTLQEIPIPEAL